jgi:hypothetical protein
MFSMNFHRRVMPYLMFLLLVFSAFSTATFASPELDDSLRFQELLARFETRRANRNAEAAKHGVILPSQKSVVSPAEFPSDEMAPHSGVSFDMPDDPLLKHLVPMTELESNFQNETTVAAPAPSPEPISSDPVIAKPGNELEFELALANPYENEIPAATDDQTTTTPQMPTTQVIKVTPAVQVAPVPVEPPSFHSHEPTPSQPNEPVVEFSNRGFTQVLAKMESRREKRNTDAERLNIQLPSAGGSFPAASPALERLNSALRSIIHHQPTTSQVG